MEKEEYWSKFAEDFEERNTYVVGKESMAIILDKVRQQKELGHALELGCGNGKYSKILAENATRLTATDFSDEMVAASVHRLNTYGNISVEKADCFCLPYAEASFDTVFMANLLHIIPEPEKAIAESRRVLKNGGKLIVVSFTDAGMSFGSRFCLIYRYLKTYGKPSSHSYTLTVEKAKKMLQKNGFQTEEAMLTGQKTKAIFVKGYC